MYYKLINDAFRQVTDLKKKSHFISKEKPETEFFVVRLMSSIRIKSEGKNVRLVWRLGDTKSVKKADYTERHAVYDGFSFPRHFSHLTLCTSAWGQMYGPHDTYHSGVSFKIIIYIV